MNEMIRHRTQTSESEKKDDIQKSDPSIDMHQQQWIKKTVNRPMPKTNKHDKSKLKPAENRLR